MWLRSRQISPVSPAASAFVRGSWSPAVLLRTALSVATDTFGELPQTPTITNLIYDSRPPRGRGSQPANEIRGRWYPVSPVLRKKRTMPVEAQRRYLVPRHCRFVRLL